MLCLYSNTDADANANANADAEIPMSRFPNGSYEEQYAPLTLEQIEPYDEIHYDLSH